MKYCLVSVLTVLVILAMTGCNPVGMDETRVYVRGLIYTDGTHTAFAEDIGLVAIGGSETYVASTGADGRFWLEMQMYADTTGIATGNITFSLTAYHSTNEYVYGGTGGLFTVAAGDTLTMYDIDLTMFESSGGGGGN